MVALTLKNIPDDLHRALKLSAKRRRRSLNSEVLKLLEEAICTQRPSIEEEFARVRKLRESIPVFLDDEMIEEMIQAGRKR